MRPALPVAAVLAHFLIPAGCRSPDVQRGSELQTFVADSNANNIALLFGAPNGLPGVSTDIKELSKVLCRSWFRTRPIGIKMEISTGRLRRSCPS